MEILTGGNKMAAEELVRKPLTVQPDEPGIAAELLGLLKSAQEELGYKPKIKTPSHSLAKAMVAADIEPFTEESVAAYKRAMLTRGMPKMHRENYRVGAAAAVFVSLLAVAIAVIHKAVAMDQNSMLVPVLFVGGIVVPFISWGVFVCTFEPVRQARTREWNRFPIVTYENPIPTFALNYALAIKKLCPSAYFEIDELQERSNHEWRQLRDPFLIAQLGDEKFYVAVWDEPEFEKRIE